jgi:hypothetical protein
VTILNNPLTNNNSKTKSNNKTKNKIKVVYTEDLTHPSILFYVSGSSIPSQEVGACHGQSVCVRVALLVRKNTAPALSG